MDNQHTDINVGNQGGADNNVLTNFQLMPKRFMVWDKEDKDWLFGGKIFTIQDLVSEFGRVPLIFETCEVVQSTNLFDKDDEEIFEGSIVRDFDGEIGVVYYDSQEGQYWAKFSNGDSTAMDSPGIMKVLGHILSNPELMEEK